MGNTIEEIIEQGFDKVSQMWFDSKKQEFRSSDIYVPEKEIHEYRNVDYVFQYEDINEEDGITSNGKIINEEEIVTEFTNTFRQYAKLPLIDSEEKSLELEVTLRSYNGGKAITYDLTSLTNEIANRLDVFFDKAKSDQISDLIYNIQDRSMILIEDSIGECQKEVHQLKKDLTLMLSEELKRRNYAFLESQKYFKPFWQKLRFKLGAEDFSALIRILESSSIIYEEKPHILDFAEKHFMIKSQGKDFSNVVSTSLRKSMDKHGTPSHTGLGLEKIKDKVLDAIADIQKPG